MKPTEPLDQTLIFSLLYRILQAFPAYILILVFFIFWGSKSFHSFLFVNLIFLSSLSHFFHSLFFHFLFFISHFFVSLSLRWHITRKTGEVITMVNRGSNSVYNLLKWVPCFKGSHLSKTWTLVVVFGSYWLQKL